MKKIIFVLAFSLMGLTGAFAQTTTLQVIHNSADPVLDSVDVYVDVPLLSLSTEILANFPFRGSFFDDLSTIVSTLGGSLPVKVQITPGGTSDTVINESVTLTSGKTYLAMAVGVIDTNSFAPNPDGLSTALKLDTIETAPIGSPAGTVTLTLFQGVTDAPSMDVFVPGIGPVITNLSYGSFSSIPFPVPGGIYELQLRNAADTSIIYGTYLADLTGDTGQALVGFTSGFMDPAANQNGAPMGLFVADTANNVRQLPLITTGVNSIGKNLSALSLYPSPAANTLNYRYTLTSSTDISVSVFNNSGALVYSRHLGTQTAGKYSESLDVSKFAAGIYTVKIGNEKSSSTSTFVKK